MSVYGHVAIGAALGMLAPHPVAALALGIASHVPADLVSHHDFNRPVELVMAAAALILYSWGGSFEPAVVLGAVGGALPDVENLFRARRGGRPLRFFPSHAGLLRHGVGTRPRGTLAQVGVAALMAAWVIWAPAFW